MAKFSNIIHSSDGCTLIIEGNKSKPEPSTVVVKFPGGNIEVSRTSTGTYWAHLTISDTDYDPVTDKPNRGIIVDSRINRTNMGVARIPDCDIITDIAIEVQKSDM